MDNLPMQVLRNLFRSRKRRPADVDYDLPALPDAGTRLLCIMGGIKKKKVKRGIEHHKRSLEETLEAPETYGVRVSEASPDCLRPTNARCVKIKKYQTFNVYADKDQACKATKGSSRSSSGRSCRQ